jgi:hypothetical protein
METQNGFTLMKGAKEISEFLRGKKISRNIDKLQLHHMGMPNYNTWEKTDKRLFVEPHFGRTQSLNDYGRKTWGDKDERGKYIAQHFNVFPDGYITSGRSLNNTPIGIKGWNTGAVCIEIYGDFDKGKDEMTPEQKKSVIELVGELCKHFKIAPSENTTRYHGWFNNDGDYLGNYIPTRSRKTCPGTNFFGGNTMDAYKKNFLPLIKNYITPPVVKKEVIYKVEITADTLNIRVKPNTKSNITGSVKKGDVFTIVKTDGDWGYLKSGAGWIHLGYTQKI